MPCEQYKYFITFKIVICTGQIESDELVIYWIAPNWNSWPEYLLMTLLLLLARLLAFGLFYKIVISCITKCMIKPLIKWWLGNLDIWICLRAIHVYISLWIQDCNSVALHMGKSNTGDSAWNKTDLKDMWSEDFCLLLAVPSPVIAHWRSSEHQPDWEKVFSALWDRVAMNCLLSQGWIYDHEGALPAKECP